MEATIVKDGSASVVQKQIPTLIELMPISAAEVDTMNATLNTTHGGTNNEIYAESLSTDTETQSQQGKVKVESVKRIEDPEKDGATALDETGMSWSDKRRVPYGEKRPTKLSKGQEEAKRQCVSDEQKETKRQVVSEGQEETKRHCVSEGQEEAKRQVVSEERRGRSAEWQRRGNEKHHRGAQRQHGSTERQHGSTERQQRGTERHYRTTERRHKSTERRNSGTERRRKSTERQHKGTERRHESKERPRRSAEKQQTSSTERREIQHQSTDGVGSQSTRRRPSWSSDQRRRQSQDRPEKLHDGGSARQGNISPSTVNYKQSKQRTHPHKPSSSLKNRDESPRIRTQPDERTLTLSHAQVSIQPHLGINNGLAVVGFGISILLCHDS